MNKAAVKALELAAFNAWVSMGDWLSLGSSRAEMREAYEHLGRALEEYKKETRK